MIGIAGTIRVLVSLSLFRVPLRIKSCPNLIQSRVV